MSHQEMLTKEDVKDLIERRCHENQLLTTRTGIVLTFNSLVAIAISRGNIPGPVGLSVSLLVILLNALWLQDSSQPVMYIEAPGKRIRQLNPMPCPKKIWGEVIRPEEHPKRLGSNKFIGKAVPVILLVAWIGGLALVVCMRIWMLTTEVGHCVWKAVFSTDIWSIFM